VPFWREWDERRGGNEEKKMKKKMNADSPVVVDIPQYPLLGYLVVITS
jgi:hypothetical protein